MLVRNTLKPPVRPKMQGNTAMQDEGWLNDVGPLPRSHIQPAIPVRSKREAGYTGCGPLEALLKDDSISEVTCIGPRHTYVERNGLLEEVPYAFESEAHMLRVIEQMVRQAGQDWQTDWPIIEARLACAVQLHAVLPPYAANGPVLTLRKEIAQEPLTLADLVRLHMLSQAMADVLLACVKGRLNVLIYGTRHSGRTTLLNALCDVIPEEERIVTIEEAPELRLRQKQLIALISQAEKPHILRQVTLRDLLQSALRLGPERIVLGECRGDETVELFHALTQGHSGSLMTIYATDAKGCLSRLETMWRNAEVSLPADMLRRQVAGSIDVTVQVSHLPDGSYKVVDIAEVLDGEHNELNAQSIFRYSTTGLDVRTGKARGEFTACGIQPGFLKKLAVMDISLPREIFVLDSRDDTVKLSQNLS